MNSYFSFHEILGLDVQSSKTPLNLRQNILDFFDFLFVNYLFTLYYLFTFLKFLFTIIR